MAKNLCYQMLSSVENGFRPGMDKHSIKKQNPEMDYKIYSYASRKELIDFSHRFTKFMKEHYSDVRMVKDIKVEHVNAYLESKTNVTKKTLEHEVSCFNKMQLCVNKKFGLHVDWKEGRVVNLQGKAEKKRDVAFDEKQILELKEYFGTKKDCDSQRAFFIGERFALRSSEIVKLKVGDIKWDEKKLAIVDSKGKRSRKIDLTQSDIDFLKQITKGLSNDSRIIPLRPDSICAYLNRACKALHMHEIVNSKSSFHCLRKYSITKYYKEREKIYGEEKAREMAMQRLGHGKNRKDLYHTYIIPWD